MTHSVSNNNFDLVNLLIENGVDVNAKDRDGRLPLIEAYTYEMGQLLIKHGAKTGAQLKAEQKK